MHKIAQEALQGRRKGSPLNSIKNVLLKWLYNNIGRMKYWLKLKKLKKECQNQQLVEEKFCRSINEKKVNNLERMRKRMAIMKKLFLMLLIIIDIIQLCQTTFAAKILLKDGNQFPPGENYWDSRANSGGKN